MIRLLGRFNSINVCMVSWTLYGAANAPALALDRAQGFEVYCESRVGPCALRMAKLRRPADTLPRAAA